ncbi:MAG: hypothetical protein ABI867_27555 [Kofleriaceae bacterium]
MRPFFAGLVFVVACGGSDSNDLATAQECNPLGGSSCMTPWPSAIYEIEDTTTATGFRLDVQATTLPENIDKIRIDPVVYNQMDGFSSAAPMITAFPGGVDGANLVGFRDVASSTTAVSPTIIIDMTTGEFVEHFAELDARSATNPDAQALFIRPAQMLKGSTRYAVAIKKTLKSKAGGELPIPEGFQAILDGTVTSHTLLERVRPRYADIFAALEAKGITKDQLVTAWDFTTASRVSVRADLLNARDTALPLMGTNGSGLDFAVTSDAPDGDTRIARKIVGEYDVPLFLSNGGSTAPSTRLVRDAAGKPVAQGMYRAPFVAIIPQCAIDSPTPVPMMIYGHGLFGQADQVASSGTRHAAAGVCAVVVGTDLRGMADVDVANVALALNDANHGHSIFEVLVQGMINHVALVQIARGPMATRLFTKTPGGVSIVDPSKFYYYGISQGGIMGTTICAIDPVIEKCVLQVGAINYSILLERSHDWPQYRSALEGAYPSVLDQALTVSLMQMQWDRTEPTGVADVILGEGFPGTPQKQVFMQIAIGDDEVSNLGSEYQARTMGIPVMTPSPYVPFGMQSSSTPVQNGMVIFDFGVGSTIPATNEPPPDNDVHSNIRNKQATIDMMKRFYETGEIVQMCTATTGCDCTNNGCGAAL